MTIWTSKKSLSHSIDVQIVITPEVLIQIIAFFNHGLIIGDLVTAVCHTAWDRDLPCWQKPKTFSRNIDMKEWGLFLRKIFFLFCFIVSSKIVVYWYRLKKPPQIAACLCTVCFKFIQFQKCISIYSNLIEILICALHIRHENIVFLKPTFN